MKCNGYIKPIKFKICIWRLMLMMCICMVITSVSVSAAGGINSNEARVLSVARGTFEYEGRTYVARQNYVDDLVAKFCAEDVNLTSEQADKAVSAIYSNVERGIKEGYIVVIDSPEDDLDRDEVDEITEVSPEEDEQNNNVNDNTDDADKQDDSSITAPVVTENDNGTTVVEDGDGNVILNVGGILKNTGFSVGRSVLCLIILGIIFTGVIICSIADILIRVMDKR